MIRPLRPSPTAWGKAAAVLATVFALSATAFTPSAGAAPAEVRGCRDGYFCMWHAQNWGGGWPDGPDPDQTFYHCTKVRISGWVGRGSYINNQTPGTVATFYGRDGVTVVGRSAAAYASNPSYDWTPVWYVKPC